jgi:3-isopropylmalate dehydrogenase
LRYSLGLEAAAQTVEGAVDVVIQRGLRTADIAGGGKSIGTIEMTDAVIEAIREIGLRGRS